ncbi:MAG: hypothetical protein AAF846_16280 [Chloroflexota bacterium]
MGHTRRKSQPVLIINDMLLALTGEKSSYETMTGATSAFAEKLAENDILLVVDDIWKSEHAKPFLRGGDRCARLLTTRFSNIAVDAKANANNVDEMTTSQSVQLLLSGIDPQPTDITPFEILAERLGEWALMLEIVNGMLREALDFGDSLVSALQFVNDVLDEEGIYGIETETDDERRHSAEGVLSASFRQLKIEEKSRLFELAIFVDDSDIPLTSVGALWDMKGTRVRKQIIRFARYSFVKYDAETQTIRLHDVVREVLETKLKTEQAPTTVHARLIRNYGLPVGTGHALSETAGERFRVRVLDDYAWRNLAYHLIQAEHRDTLRDLLLTFDYLQNKLDATDPNALIADCDVYLSEDWENNHPIDLIKSAITMSSHILDNYPTLLPAQLTARLISHTKNYLPIDLLVKDSYRAKEVNLFPTHQTFQSAGGALIRTLSGHTSAIWGVTMHKSYAVSASSDNILKVWNWRTGELLRTLEGHKSSVWSVAVSGSYAVSASYDETLKVWNWQTGELLRTLEGHKSSVRSVVIVGSYAVSTSDDKTLKVWNWQTGELLRTLEGHKSSVWSVAVSGSYAVSASDDKTLKVWNWQTGELLRTLEGHKSSVWSVAVSGSYAVSASSDDMLIVWNWETGELLRTLEGHTSAVRSVAVSGSYVVSASSDITLKVWNWRTDELLRTLRGHTSAVRSVVVSGSYAMSASSDHTLKVWNWKSGEDIRMLEQHTSSVRSVAVSGSYAVSASSDHTLKVWNWKSGELLRTLEGHTSAVRSVVMSGSYALSVSLDKTLRVWNWQTGELLRTLEGHTSSVRSVAVSGSYVLSASDDKTLKVWNWQTGELLRTLEGHTNWVNSVSVSGSYAVSASYDKTLKVWSWENGEEINILQGHMSAVRSVVVSGSYAVSASDDTTLKVWNWRTGELLRTLRGHISSVRSLAISGSYVLSTSWDETLKVWDWQTGDCLYTFYADAPLRSVVIAPNFECIIVGDAQGNVHFLRPNAALLKLLRGQ